MNKKDWAAKEAELYCKKVESKYAKQCALAALEAFNFIADQGHSGCSIGVTKSILFDWLDGRPLTAVEGADDEWVLAYSTEDSKVYRNLRIFTLFKTVYTDGWVQCEDLGTSYCIDSYTGASYTNTFIQREALKALSEQGIDDYCVKFPYFPNREKLEIVTEACMYDKTQKGDCDTVGILYVNVPQQGRVDVGKFYKETENGFEPIIKVEYDMRILASQNEA